MCTLRAQCAHQMSMCASNYSWRLFGDLVSPLHPIPSIASVYGEIHPRLSGFCLSTIRAKAFQTHKKHVHRSQCNLFHINTITTHLHFSSSSYLIPFICLDFASLSCGEATFCFLFLSYSVRWDYKQPLRFNNKNEAHCAQNEILITHTLMHRTQKNIPNLRADNSDFNRSLFTLIHWCNFFL